MFHWILSKKGLTISNRNETLYQQEKLSVWIELIKDNNEIKDQTLNKIKYLCLSSNLRLQEEEDFKALPIEPSITVKAEGMII